MSFFLLNLAYAGKLVFVIIIAENRSFVCEHPNDICRRVAALDLFNQ